MQNELSNQRKAVEQMQETLVSIRSDVESGSLQFGVGDVADKKDDELKQRLRSVSDSERNLLRNQGGRLGARINGVYSTIDDVEKNLALFKREVENEAVRRTEMIEKTVQTERDKIASYSSEIQSLGSEAEEVVGGVAFENFSSVRKRFQELVLKADVGIIDVAWLRKEEHTARVAELTKGRLREIKVLDDEFQQVKKEK
jgi:ElaB/YqjD/DUF883 family membrane-anchored ribosome-binding protein